MATLNNLSLQDLSEQKHFWLWEMQPVEDKKPETAEESTAHAPDEKEVNQKHPLKPEQQAELMLNAWNSRAKARQSQAQEDAVEEREDTTVLKKPGMKRPGSADDLRQQVDRTILECFRHDSLRAH